MGDSITLLSVTAISIGFIHTILGPDHYLPFIVLSEAKKWNLRKTMFITFLCGLGHVLSSVVLGLIGIAVGISVKKLIKNSFTDNFESYHDEIIHDGRYDYLGRVDFVKLTDKLLRERTEYGKHTDRKKWIEMQKKTVLEHEFRTDTAKLLRSVPVEEQMKGLEEYGG